MINKWTVENWGRTQFQKLIFENGKRIGVIDLAMLDTEQEAKQYTHDILDKLNKYDALKEENKKLKDAISGILLSWDKNMRGDREQYNTPKGNFPGYWSPAAAMVDSEFISAARKLIDNQ